MRVAFTLSKVVDGGGELATAAFEDVAATFDDAVTDGTLVVAIADKASADGTPLPSGVSIDLSAWADDKPSEFRASLCDGAYPFTTDDETVNHFVSVDCSKATHDGDQCGA